MKNENTLWLKATKRQVHSFIYMKFSDSYLKPAEVWFPGSVTGKVDTEALETG